MFFSKQVISVKIGSRRELHVSKAAGEFSYRKAGKHYAISHNNSGLAARRVKTLTEARKLTWALSLVPELWDGVQAEGPVWTAFRDRVWEIVQDYKQP